MKEGFDPAKGGSGAASHSSNSDYVKNSSGKVHFTKDRNIARKFADYTQTAEELKAKGMSGASVHLRASAGFMKPNIPFIGKGKVLKVRVSDNAWKDFKPDQDMGGIKSTAATIDKKVSTSSIAGHSDSKGIKQFLNKKHLSKYYSTTSGKLRGLAGVALGLAGAGLAGKAVYNELNGK